MSSYLVPLHVHFVLLVAGDADGDELAAEGSLVGELALVGELVLVAGRRDDLLRRQEVGVRPAVALNLASRPCRW